MAWMSARIVAKVPDGHAHSPISWRPRFVHCWMGVYLGAKFRLAVKGESQLLLPMRGRRPAARSPRDGGRGTV